MGYEIIKMSREELYEKVWSTPSVILCKEFCFSDVALSKLCKKHQIPKPPKGYWAKVQNGQKVARTPLPKIYNDTLERVRVKKLMIPNGSAPGVVELGATSAKAMKEKIEVPAVPERNHDLAARACEVLQGSSPDANGIVEPKIDCLDIRVGRSSIDRAVNLFNSLLWALEGEKCNFVVKRANGDQITQILVDGETIRIRLEEPLEIRPRELSPKEKRELELRPWMEKKLAYENIPSGKLSFQILDLYQPGARTKWSDTKLARLESNLNTVLSGIFSVAQVKKADRLEREEKERQREEARRVEEEEERAEEDAQRRELDLSIKLEEWQRSKALNDYLDGLEKSWIEKYGAIDSKCEFAAWLAWARKYAYALNPIPRIIESKEPYNKELDLSSPRSASDSSYEAPRERPWFPGKKWYQR